jgi:hypothetical protein
MGNATTAIGLLLLALLALPGAARAAEPHDSGWAFYMDNDALAPRRSDRDYTGGFSLTVAGRRARDAWWSVDPLRRGADRLLGLEEGPITRHSAEAGVTIFTPASLSDVEKQAGDRPYASLLYLANTGVSVWPERDLAYISTFTVGILGAPVVGNAQSALHRAIGSEEPMGWDKQVSDGGELTARYAFARVNRAWAGANGEATTTWYASLGYLTELTYGVAARFGEFRTPWWSYNPQITQYAEKSIPVVASEGGGAERYFWGGFAVKARGYNAFLQGQLRESDVTFSRSELRPVILEGWLGYTVAASRGWRVSYVLRAQSSEMRDGPADRAQSWGGIVLSFAR